MIPLTRMTLALAAGIVLLAVPGARAQAPIQVVLNGTPLRVNTPPVQVNGSTLVPMRDIFEALGASVRFDKATQTVYGQKGATAIVLPVGALAATVNGTPRPLPQAAQLVRGTTLVPLRFISEALGASVRWNPASSTVTIQTVDQHVGSLPAPPASEGGVVTGQLTGVYTNTTPTQITVRVGGKKHRGAAGGKHNRPALVCGAARDRSPPVRPEAGRPGDNTARRRRHRHHRDGQLRRSQRHDCRYRQAGLGQCRPDPGQRARGGAGAGRPDHV